MADKYLMAGEQNTYANIFTFMNFPLSRSLDESVDTVVMGVPYDLATTGRSGTRYGPNGIRQASAQLRWEEKRWPWKFKLADRLHVIDYGDVCFEDGAHDDLMEVVISEAGKVFGAGKKLLSFGGDHFLSLPLLRAATAKHGPLALIHFDAHTDTDAKEHLYNHGSMFYHAVKEGLLQTDNSVQVGIRTEYTTENHPFKVLDAVWVNNNNANVIGTAIRDIVADKPIYLSIDIDFLDPAYAPGTGTPVAGGVNTDKALQILRELYSLNIVGMDLMEVAPAYDHADVTSLAAATLALEMLYMTAAKPGDLL